MRLRLLNRSIVYLIIIGFVLQLAPPAQAQELEINETFKNPALPNWETTGEVYVEQETLILGDNGEARYQESWAAFELIIQLRLDGPGEFVISTHEREAGSLDLLLSREFIILADQGQPLVEMPLEDFPDEEWVTLVYAIVDEKARVEINGEMIIHDQELPIQQHPGVFSFRYQGPGLAAVDTVDGGGANVSGIEPGSSPELSPTPELDQELDAKPTSTSEISLESTDVPAYQAGSWVHLGGPLGGLGYDIRYNYENHDIWYVTDDWAGIHRSTDRGLTWEPVNEGITAVKQVDAVPIFTVTVDHIDSDVVWVGTSSSGQIFRSQDGGDTWVEMSNGIDQNLRPLSFRGITIHPTNNDILYAMAEISSVAWSPDHQEQMGFEMEKTKGIVYKTTNGGKNWKEIWRGDNLARYAWINPDNPDIVYVSTGIFDREAANTDVEANIAGGVGILKSFDGGQTWTVLDQDNGLLDLYVGSLYMHPEDPDTLLAAASNTAWDNSEGETNRGVYMTEDGGESWKLVINRSELFGAVEYCEQNPDFAYAASRSAVYRSEDGGKNWTRYGRSDDTWGPSGVIAGLPIDMQCDPDDMMRIFVNNYGGGNFLSTDGGKTWVNASTGYTGALMRDLAVVTGEPGWVYAAARSGLFRSTDGGATWQGTAYPGEDLAGKPLDEVISLALHPENPLIIISAPIDLMGITISLDGGQSWSLAKGEFSHPKSIEFAPSDPSVVYAANFTDKCMKDAPGAIEAKICEESKPGLYVSRDEGRTWNQTGESEITRSGILALAVHPTDPDTVFIGTRNGEFAVSKDGGQTWEKTPQNQIPPEEIRAIAVDPGSPDTLYIGYEGMGVYKSTDGGDSWQMLTAGMPPEADVRSIVVDPTDSNVVYLTDMRSGVLYSTDGGGIFQPLNEGLTHRTARTLAISDDGSVLYVGIEGAGVYRLGTPPVVENADALFDNLSTGETLQSEAVGETDEQSQEEESLETKTEQDDFEAEEEKQPNTLDPGSDEEELEGQICPGSYLPLLVALLGSGIIRRQKREFDL